MGLSFYIENWGDCLSAKNTVFRDEFCVEIETMRDAE